MKKLLKKISYNPFVIRLIRLFRLQRIFRKLYFYFLKPPGGILTVQIGEINVKFYVSTPEQLRGLESDREGEREVVELLISNLQPGDIVYDIGANVGFYSVILGKAVGERGKVIAFEPEKESYNLLQRNLKLNNLINVYTFQKALGNENKEGELFLGQTIGNFSLVKTYEKEINSQKVEIVKGDQFVRDQSLPIPKAVKIDVEGYEYSVLLGLRETLSNSKCQIICCEVHPRLLPPEVKEGKIRNIIKSFGFKRFKTYRRINDYHLIGTKK